LTVFYRVGGTATPGKDFVELPGEILIPEGREAAELVIQTLADGLDEETETVVVEILVPPCIEIYPPPPGCYSTGDQPEAMGTIVDPNAPPAGFVFVPSGSDWHYWNQEEPPPGNWLEDELDFPDWPMGPAPLGYGDGDEATITREGKAPHPMTAYFRRHFEVPADLGVAALHVKLVRDDGAAMYLNGVELLRDNLPEGELTFDTPARRVIGGEAESAWHTFEVPADALRVGPNLLGVEVHQNNPMSSDLSFDLELAGIVDTSPDKPVVRIEATVPETMEPSPEVRVRPGQFTISRTGPVDEPLTVACGFGGSASPVADYRLDPTPVMASFTIPAGKASLDVYVGPVDDELAEGDETVVAVLARMLNGLPNPEAGWHNPAYSIDPNQARATVVIHDNDQPSAAELVIVHPPPGILWPAGEPLPIDIVATDPNGYIARVEVFAGETQIGVSEIAFFVAPPPGTPIEHHVEWTNPPAGKHLLRAVAVNSAGEQVVSERVPIFVEPAFEQVVLTVTAPYPATAEPGPLVDPAPAAFVIERVAGPLHVEVPVYFRLGGTATEGKDYFELPRDLVLASGETRLSVPLIGMPDDLVEGEENVVFELSPPICPAIYPPPPWCYRVGEPDRAEIVIHDSTDPENMPPRVTIVHPRHGAVLALDEQVEVVVEAADPDGEVVSLALHIDGEEAASTEGARLVATWMPAGPGQYVLRAMATDNDGATGNSDRVKVFLRETDIRSFVRRDLPGGYVPGQPFEVVLEVLPPDHGIAWAVEDRPPVGWPVEAVSHDGFFDPATGKVKFGPFLDRGPRLLTYVVMPPGDAAGRHGFSGHGSVDGENSPISGDRVIAPAEHRHPADHTPPEMALTLAEMTAYVSAWKQGHEWPHGPNPIPLAYVTKAGALWKHGEAYEYDPSLGAPPACWVNPLPPVESPASGLAEEGSATGERQLPEGCQPGKGFIARISVRPPAETTAWAVEEEVPPGWEIAEISHEGQFDPNTRRVRWGLFFGNEPSELSYTAIAPGHVTSIGHFHGQVSFDGRVMPLVGGREAVATDASTEVRFTRVEREGKGPVRLRIRGGAGQLVVVECSDDLRHWKEIAPVGLVEGELEFEDVPEDGGEIRFYRARPIGP
jgi:hypothetical protein